jgi:hypothetical protein
MTKEEKSGLHASSMGYLWSVQYLPRASVYTASLWSAAPHVIAVPLIASWRFILLTEV